MQRKQLARAIPLSSIVAIAVLLAMTFAPVASAATTLTVTPNNMNGWAFGWDTNDYNGSGGFAFGPAMPPMGIGSLELAIASSSTARPIVGTAAYNGTQFSQITALSYDTFVSTPTAPPDVLAITLSFNVDYDLTDAITSWQGRLTYEPYFSGTVQSGVWQSWNAMSGNWWASGAPGNTLCPQSSPCSWSQVLSNWPKAGVHATLGAVIFKAGGPWTTFSGNVDAFTIGVSSNDTIYDFEPPSTVYVDDDWTSTALWADPDGAGPATAFGLDAFATIQDGVDAVTPGGTVHVAAGTYAENVAVNKAVDLRGPNYGVSPNTGTRVAEAVIVPGTSAIATGEILAVSASNVSINGFAIDGDNPLLTSGYLGTTGADIDAAEGVTVYVDNVNNLSVAKNVFRNLSYFGVTLFGGSYSAPATTGHLVDDNKFMDFGTYDAGSGIAKWGGGVLLYNNQYTRITGNVMTNVRLGIQTGNFSRSNTGTAMYQVIDGNSMQVRRVGIFHNLAYGPTSPYTLSNNSITGLADANEAGVKGIVLSSLSVPSTSQGNTINLNGVIAPSIGYEVWNVKSTSPAAISGGNASNVDIGLFLNNFEGYNSNADDGAHASVSGLSISPNAGGTGIRVLDSPSSTTHANVQLAIGAGVSVAGGAKGLTVENTAASVTSVSDLVLSGQTGNYIELVSNGSNIDATGVSFDGQTGATATLAQNFAIEDKVVHELDDSSLGLVRVKAGELFVTTNSGSIQRGIDAATAGDIVNVAVGTYVEQVEIAKDLTLKGAGSGTIIQSPATLPLYFQVASGPKNYPVVYVHAANAVTIQDLVVDGAGKGNANYRFQGIGLHNAGGTVSGVEIKDVRDTPFSGSQHGVALYAYNEDGTPRTLEVTGCDIHDFQKNGTALGGPELTVNVHDTTVTGYGPTAVTAQNGIQVGYGAVGAVGPDNVVSAISYTPSTWVASGVLLYDADVDVFENTVTNSQVGIYLYKGTSAIHDNVVTATEAGVGTTVFSGIVVVDPPHALPSPFLEEPVAANRVVGPDNLTVNVSNNTLIGSCSADSYGLEAYAGYYGSDDIDFTATGNTITNWGTGVAVAKCTGTCTTSDFGSVHVNHNTIASNCQYGMYVSGLTSPVDAEDNYWGAVSGPGPVGVGTGNNVSVGVDYEPWCNEDFSICGYTTATMTPATTDDLFCVGETTTVNIDIATVANLYGYQFAVTYDATKASADGDFVDDFFDTTLANIGAGWDADCAAGTCRFSAAMQAPDGAAVTGGGTLAQIVFTGVAPGAFDITIGSAARLTDIDGELLARTLALPLPVTVCGSTTVSGKVTLQGRSGNIVNPGTVTLTDLGGNFPSINTPFSVPDGSFSFANVPVMPTGSNYQLDAAHPLYLTNRQTPVGLTYSVPLTNQTTRLWGGDANNDGGVEVDDLSCIGGAFDIFPVTSTCSGTGSPDINADTVVNVQDLAIAGGNFDKCGAQPWAWLTGTPVLCVPPP